MTSRQRKIYELFTEHEYLTSLRIAEILHISDRTVRTDIREINNQMGEEVIQARKGQGYRLVQGKKHTDNISAEHIDLEWELVRRILFEEKVPYLELADELYISDTLLSRIVNRVNHAMDNRYGRGSIQKKQGYLLLDLTEEDKRDYYHVYVTMRNVNHFFNLEEYQEYFEFVLLDDIRQLLLSAVNAGKQQLYDTTLMRLLLSTAIMAERAASGYLLAGEVQEVTGDSMVDSLMNGLERLVKTRLPPGEYQYMVKIIRNDFYYIQEGRMKEVKVLLQKILIEISVEYGFDLSQNLEFIREMEAQLNGTIMRASNCQWAVNPALVQIKSKYPLEYDIAVFFADRLQKNAKVAVSEDEIGQFAVHFIWAMEQNLGSMEQKAVLINPYGKQIKDLLKNRLEEMGEYRLTIAYSYSFFDYPAEMPKDAAVLLTTVSLPKASVDIPVILCKNFLDYHEKEKLMTVLKENQVGSVKRYFQTLFKPSLFFTDMEFDSKEHAISFLCSQLYHQGYVDEGFCDSVMQRERLAPTAFEPGFAFAHAMENNAGRTAICTCILKNKLPWGDYQVKIIFLFALASSWNHTMIPVYNVMIDHLFQSNILNKLTKKKDCAGFVELLL